MDQKLTETEQRYGQGGPTEPRPQGKPFRQRRGGFHFELSVLVSQRAVDGHFDVPPAGLAEFKFGGAKKLVGCGFGCGHLRDCAAGVIAGRCFESDLTVAHQFVRIGVLDKYADIDWPGPQGGR